MVLITIVTGAYKATNITGGPHIVVTMSFETALLTTELFSIRISGETTRWVLTSSAWLLFWPRGTY